MNPTKISFLNLVEIIIFYGNIWDIVNSTKGTKFNNGKCNWRHKGVSLHSYSSRRLCFRKPAYLNYLNIINIDLINRFKIYWKFWNIMYIGFKRIIKLSLSIFDIRTRYNQEKILSEFYYFGSYFIFSYLVHWFT